MKRIVLSVLSLLCVTAIGAQQRHVQEPFSVLQEFVSDISSCDLTGVDVVYGDVTQKTSGFLTLVTPHPEAALVSPLSSKTVDPNNFRVWVVAKNRGNNTNFGLFSANNQILKYLEIKRKSTKNFALFISQEEMEERIPRGDTRGMTPIIHFELQFHFARDAQARWPMETAVPKAHPGKVMNYFYNYFPQEYFLSVKLDPVDEASQYMDKHPNQKYYYGREEVWNSMGWFMNLTYHHKGLIRDKINDNHYVIFTLWKDKEHTKPLLISYMKDNLYPGGAATDPSRMEERFNYVAYPHKGFDDWSLFIPWECIDYWWKDGIIPTKENHTCIAYYTLTLSNDGKTSATAKDYDVEGWLSVEKEVYEPTPSTPPSTAETADTCKHLHTTYHIDKVGSVSYPTGDGCTTDYIQYREWLVCKDCNETLRSKIVPQPFQTRDLQHRLKEVGNPVRVVIKAIEDHFFTKYTINNIVRACQNECCKYRDTIEIRDSVKIPLPPEKPLCDHEWVVTSHKLSDYIEYKIYNQATWKYYYDIIQKERTCRKCKEKALLNRENQLTRIEGPFPVPEQEPEPCVHDWVYYSNQYRRSVYERDSKTVKAYSGDSLNISLGDAMVKMYEFDHDAHIYMSPRPVSRQQWLAVNKDNNYMGISAEDTGLLNAVTYQEAYDFIEALNRRVREEQNVEMLFSLPTEDEMRQLIMSGQVKFEKGRVQEMTYFYVDSIEVYDGKGRQVTDQQLSTAPEGAKVRIMVGRMGQDGKVQMVDISTADQNTAFYLKAVTVDSKENVTVRRSRFYKTHYRRCQKCGKEERLSENIFRNMRYHKPLFDE